MIADLEDSSADGALYEALSGKGVAVDEGSQEGQAGDLHSGSTKGAAPSTIAVASAAGDLVRADATAKAKGARGQSLDVL
jgi:hypothetical protein